MRSFFVSLVVITVVVSSDASITSDKCKAGEKTPHFFTDIMQVPNHYCKCTSKELGTLRYRGDDRGLQICNGREFVSACGETKTRRTKLGTKEYPVESCRYLADVDSLATSGIYYVRVGNETTRAYCVMDTICGESGWTMLMKIDGTKRTFHYDSAYWSNHKEYNVDAVSDGLNGNSELKLKTYSHTPFTKLCVGLRNKDDLRWLPITMAQKVDSLYSVIAPGKHVATNLGRDRWKNLVAGSSLQPNCNTEGFNVYGTWGVYVTSKARIGIIGNNENDCASPDSRLGLGTGGRGCGTRDYSAGNEASCGGDAGNKSIVGMGFILVF
ncbi:uncharacterized protein LOC116618617 [Nematostella vectensis]|uniref:uncharacterized protein LOC116618617 n=1 Tax=Nematostella vectensis TaxID=45351 RepID=UPI00138FA883|nr:uncharacterized protein LOC116618617 [Nematostella vectensis]XP_032238431.1 uncharacterized protein LOC116618617 [Nematostella vectensis]XP_032238432.1 uncharacterized protein LOC116618617 [Nematostella vectensis]XP_032238433.1 uncharacterized protein LOC116618617 [Nematostella vectensis]